MEASKPRRRRSRDDEKERLGMNVLECREGVVQQTGKVV